MRGKMQKYIVVIILCLIQGLYGADINATLIEANTTAYKTLLQKLPDANLTAEEALEKTLLSELSKPWSPKAAVTVPKTITNEKMYRKLFMRYVSDIRDIDALVEKLEKTKEKITLVEKRIAQARPDDEDLFSMQLQDAFYHKHIQHYIEQIKERNARKNALSALFEAHLEEIPLPAEKIRERLSVYSRLAKKYKETLTKLKIEQDQIVLGNNKEKIRQVESKIKEMKRAYLFILNDMLSERFLLFSSALQQKDETAFFLGREIRDQIKEMNTVASSEVYNGVVPLLLSMENRYMGHLSTLVFAGKEEVGKIFSTTWRYINRPLFSTEETPISIFKIIVTMIIIVFGFLIAGVYQRKVRQLTEGKRSITQSTQTMLANMGYYLIIVIAFFVALNALGLKLSSLALVAGALSVGIGFGLQNIVSNFVSGLILMFERSIKIGDFVQLNENNLSGHVTDIRMRSTTINTNDNIDIIVPNQEFIQHDVINWTMNDKIRRFEIPFGVKYGTDAEKLVGIILKAVNQSGFTDIYINGEKHTRVLMTEMGDSSVNFVLQIWIKGNDILFPKRTASRFLILIYKTLYENDIEIPFPQRDLHIRSVDTVIPVRMAEK